MFILSNTNKSFWLLNYFCFFKNLKICNLYYDLELQTKTTDERSNRATESQNRVALEESSQFSDDDISPEEAQMVGFKLNILFILNNVFIVAILFWTHVKLGGT